MPSASGASGWKIRSGRYWLRLNEVRINMHEVAPKNVMYSIPDDPESSTYRFIIVAAKRARQLQNGARSFLPSTSKKPTVASMEEVRRGLVKYEDSNREIREPME